MVQIFQCNPWYGHEFCEVRHSSYFGRNAWASHQHRSVSQQDLRYYPTHGNLGITGYGYQYGYDYFSKGTPIFLEYMGLEYASILMNGDFCLAKFLVALAISVTMNSIFAPVFMTLHKITDTHIGNCGGSIKALSTPIPMTRIFTGLNWAVLWSFVFKKTIPLFWYPAHTITFLLPPDMRVLFAAILGVVLGVLLAIAAKKK